MSAALAGLVILAIGDSQMMNMLSNLHSQLQDNGATVYSYAMCGSTAADWTAPSTASCGTGMHLDKASVVFDQKTHPGWNISQLIAQHHPNLVIVELADTMAGYGTAQMDVPWIRSQVTGLTGKIAANKISCVWVGPAWGQDTAPYNKTVTRVTEMSKLLASSVAPCAYIDSTTFSRPGEWQTRDGGHLQPDAYRKWSRDISDAVVRLKAQGAIVAH
jgi:hypothetical protein